ncbi:hypothetical protein [Helicobacter sp. 23-1046]
MQRFGIFPQGTHEQCANLVSKCQKLRKHHRNYFDCANTNLKYFVIARESVRILVAI